MDLYISNAIDAFLVPFLTALKSGLLLLVLLIVSITVVIN